MKQHQNLFTEKRVVVDILNINTKLNDEKQTKSTNKNHWSFYRKSHMQKYVPQFHIPEDHAYDLENLLLI